MNARSILKQYRKIQYALCGRSHYGVMEAGVLCTHEPFEHEVNYGDIVHPCVRYIPEGYEGHCWWMVYTPYYKSNAKTENPILCYAENNTAEYPTHWLVYCQVQKQPQKGYNSDPVLLYANKTLYVFWRENLTDRCDSYGYVRATFGGIIRNGGICNIFGPVVGTRNEEEDPETSPVFVQEPDGTFKCFATHITFHSVIIKKLPLYIRQIVNKVVLVLDLLGIWSQQKAHGISLWTSNKIEGSYQLLSTNRLQNKNWLYRPWHIDCFEWKGVLYAIIQSNQCNADICLAESQDRINFRLFKKPLMTNETCGKVGIYKPSAGVVNGKFFLYYTAQDINNRALNKLYLTTMDFDELLKKIR